MKSVVGAEHRRKVERTKVKKAFVLLMVAVSMTVAIITMTSCKNHIVVGVIDDYQPFSYKNSDGDFVGFDVAYIALLSKQIGKEIKIKSVKRDDCEKMLKDKSVDMLWNLSRTKKRSERFLFTNNYLIDSAALVVRQYEYDNETIQQASKIAIQAIGTQDQWLKEQGLRDKAINCENMSDTMHKLQNFEVDAALVDLAFAKYFLQHQQKEGDTKLTIIDSNIYNIICNAALRLGDSALAELINEGIKKVNQSKGFATLCNVWFGSAAGFDNCR